MRPLRYRALIKKRCSEEGTSTRVHFYKLIRENSIFCKTFIFSWFLIPSYWVTINTRCNEPFVFPCDWPAFGSDDFYLSACFNKMNIAWQKPPGHDGEAAFPFLEKGVLNDWSPCWGHTVHVTLWGLPRETAPILSPNFLPVSRRKAGLGDLMNIWARLQCSARETARGFQLQIRCLCLC